MNKKGVDYQTLVYLIVGAVVVIVIIGLLMSTYEEGSFHISRIPDLIRGIFS